MRQKGQRQDVAFLALAVAVLAIAVALFMGIRSLPKRGGEKPKAETAKTGEQKPPKAEPVGSPDHDPFKAEPTSGAVTAKATPTPGEELRLAGIVQGKSPLAVIRRGEKRYYVRVGSEVSGYRLKSIGSGRVVLTKGEQSITLTLHEAASEGEAEVAGGGEAAGTD